MSDNPRAAPMRVFMFKSAERRRYALSADPSGRNIPRGALAVGGWIFIRPVDLVVGEVQPGFDADEAVRAIRADGYALIGFPFHAD